jgi:hypothetical protein
MTIDHESRRDSDAVAATRESIDNSMGPRPTQAVFFGGLAVALATLMIGATAFVLLSAMTYG